MLMKLRVKVMILGASLRLYEDLKTRLAEDVQSRAKPDITIKPVPKPEEMSVEGEQDEGIIY